MGLRRDENTSKVVLEELIDAIGTNRDVRHLGGELKKIKAGLEEKYTHISTVLEEEQVKCTCKRGELRTAGQKHRRKVFKMVHKDYFGSKDEEELQKQLQGSESLRSSETRNIPCNSALERWTSSAIWTTPYLRTTLCNERQKRSMLGLPTPLCASRSSTTNLKEGETNAVRC